MHVQVQYNDEDIVLSPERAMSMLLKCMQNIAVQDQGTPVVDCVLAVPAYFTDAERRAMYDAASIAGLNCLRLMNDTTAGALELWLGSAVCSLAQHKDLLSMLCSRVVDARIDLPAA